MNEAQLEQLVTPSGVCSQVMALLSPSKYSSTEIREHAHVTTAEFNTGPLPI